MKDQLAVIYNLAPQLMLACDTIWVPFALTGATPIKMPPSPSRLPEADQIEAANGEWDVPGVFHSFQNMKQILIAAILNRN